MLMVFKKDREHRGRQGRPRSKQKKRKRKEMEGRAVKLGNLGQSQWDVMGVSCILIRVTH